MKNENVPTNNALAATYRVNGNTFIFNSDDPALVFGGDTARGLLKSDFQKAHKDGGEQLKNFADAFGVTADNFKKSIRTVGTGTHLLLREASGGQGRLLLNPLVARTDTGEDGTVNLGKHSRAAGGACGSISESNFRELQEEFFCTHNLDGSLTVYYIDYNENSLSKDVKDRIIAIKQKEAQEILQANGMAGYVYSVKPLNGKILSVPGLTKNITQIINGSQKSVANRILKDNPISGDFAAVDTIILADLPTGIIFNNIRILDGERNTQGELLNRQWRIKTVENWITNIKGGLPISPAAKPFYDRWKDVSNIVMQHKPTTM